MLFHALQNHARVERRPLDGGEQFVLRGVRQLPAERHAAEFGIHQHRAVAVVPGHPQQSGLARCERLEPLDSAATVDPGAACDRIEDIAGGRKARLDAGESRMNAARHNAADTRNQLRLFGDGHDARRGADNVHHVAGPAAGADRIPMGVERAHRNRNTRTQPEFRGPLRTQACRRPHR